MPSKQIQIKATTTTQSKLLQNAHFPSELKMFYFDTFPVSEHSRHIVRIKQWLAEKLRKIEEEVRSLEVDQRSHMTHRIGPNEVTFDIEQEPNISRDKLTIRSQGRFMTAKANTCVYGGKWQFEVSYMRGHELKLGHLVCFLFEGATPSGGSFVFWHFNFF